MLRLLLIIFITGQLSLACSNEIDCSIPKDSNEITSCYNMNLKHPSSKSYKFDSYTVLTREKQIYTRYMLDTPKIIFGKKSGLNEILSVAIACTGEEIAILNRNSKGEKEILIFPLVLSGTVKPFRVISSKDLDKVERIIFDNGGRELIAISDTQETAISFTSKANSLSFKKELQPVSTVRDYKEF